MKWPEKIDSNVTNCIDEMLLPPITRYILISGKMSLYLDKKFGSVSLLGRERDIFNKSLCQASIYKHVNACIYVAAPPLGRHTHMFIYLHGRVEIWTYKIYWVQWEIRGSLKWKDTECRLRQTGSIRTKSCNVLCKRLKTLDTFPLSSYIHL